MKRSFSHIPAGHPAIFHHQEAMYRPGKMNELIMKARESERKLVGRDLHDNVNQLLSTVKLFLDMLDPQKAKEKYIREKSIGYVMLAIDEIRRISHELVSGEPDKRLATKIQGLIDDIQFSAKIGISFYCDPGVENIDPEKKTTLLRIVQEQLKNIIYYSKAKQVAIRIVLANGNVVLTIQDDGIGFDSAKMNKGIGLTNIYERTVCFNGSVDLKTAAGKGCLLEVSLPVA